MMDFSIDRQSQVPIRQQLKGMIEYAIACGELAPGESLPSVRELAATIGVAPMTISQVYSQLKARGLVTTYSGIGTCVIDDVCSRYPARLEVLSLHRRIDALLDECDMLDVQPADLYSMISARLVDRSKTGRRILVVVVGLFAEATAGYAQAIADKAGRNATIEPLLFDAIKSDPGVRKRAKAADLVVTMIDQQYAVAAQVGAARTIAIRFIPSQKTRCLLASIDPLARILLVSRFAPFLPVMKAGVSRFAAHVDEVRAGNVGDEDLEESMQKANVVIYSTGAESVLHKLKPGTDTIEYRHTPAPTDIERVILPKIRSLTSLSPQPEEA